MFLACDFAAKFTCETVSIKQNWIFKHLIQVHFFPERLIGELPKLCVKIRPDSWLVCGPFRCHHEWQHGGLCPCRCSFGCVLLLDQIFRKQFTVRQYTTLIYLINLLGKLVLGLWLDSELHYFSIFTENKKMSTLSSANVTDVNLVLKERTHMHLCLNMLIFMHNLGNWLILQFEKDSSCCQSVT